MKKKYGFMHFMWDLFLGFITFGLWWVYLLFRALRSK
jgi:hypothetical protein